MLPPEMFGFYKSNLDYLREHSVDPDKRRYSVKEEGPRHYIDLDHYVLCCWPNMQNIGAVLPLRWNEGDSIYSWQDLEEYGVLPWHLNKMYHRLVDAFKNNDAEAILSISAEIGHYASDAHVPLHTTENYNGQLTDQIGIHALWESRIPERKSDEFSLFIGKAQYLDDVQMCVWQVIEQSFGHLAYVLETEKKLRFEFEKDKIYRPSTVGKGVKPQFTSAYVDAYAEDQLELVEKRMKSSAEFTASLWYTAWVNAGQPDLKGMQAPIENKKAVEPVDSTALEDHKR